jgi:hypothetical protein
MNDDFDILRFSETMIAKCVGFKSYNIFLDENEEFFAGSILNNGFTPGPEYPNLTSKELLELSYLMEGINILVLH